MIKKKVLDPNRVRCIERGFSFIPHRFLTDGFLASLDQRELLLYFFLVLVSDRQGLSFYSYDAICSLLQSPQHALSVLAAYLGHTTFLHTSIYLKVVDASSRNNLYDFSVWQKGKP